jgi:hypothetical protein
MLIGEQDAGGVSLMECAGFAFGCLQPAVLEELISRVALIEVNPTPPHPTPPHPTPPHPTPPNPTPLHAQSSFAGIIR